MSAKKKPISLVGSDQIALLERLSNACAVSGGEGEVRKIVLEELKDFADETIVDALGNVLVTRKSMVDHPLRVMVAAHMDEVGFMLVGEEDGMFRFEVVGGIDKRQLVGKPVWVGSKHVPGVIGAKPIHLTEEGETERAIPLDALKIDIGPDGGTKAKVGDRATFATTFRRSGISLCGKALDDRLGVATLIELVRKAPPTIELLAAFTVQEEIGLRGARVAGYHFNPDMAIVIDATPANDLPDWQGNENISYNTRLGFGPAIYVADGMTISDPRLVRYLMTTADAYGIPFQVRQPGAGGTDAGAIHKQRGGIPSVSISVPVRYAHTAMLVARLSDWDQYATLIHSALSGLTRDLFEKTLPLQR
jgi:putative aminopeptidase FrvX